MAKKKHQDNRDPWPYEGPVRRADGVSPYNHFLWPMLGDDWWANRELDDRIDSRWHFAIFALADGRFATSGHICDIEDNDHAGRSCVFENRNQALRVSAARMIRKARASRKWEGMWCGQDLELVINWARKVVARETGRAEPKPVQVKQPPPVRIATGLPLFDFAYHP